MFFAGSINTTARALELKRNTQVTTRPRRPLPPRPAVPRAKSIPPPEALTTLAASSRSYEPLGAPSLTVKPVWSVGFEYECAVRIAVPKDRKSRLRDAGAAVRTEALRRGTSVVGVHFKPHGYWLPERFATLVRSLCALDASYRVRLLIGGADAWFPDDFPDSYTPPPFEYAYTNVSRLLDRKRCPAIVDVRAQNLNASALPTAAGAAARTAPLPIGLDLHTLRERGAWGEKRAASHEQLEALRAEGAAAAPVERRTRLIVLAFDQRADHTPRAGRTGRWGPKGRRKLRGELIRSGVALDVSSGLARGELWRTFARHAVVASPHGLGSDVHRTWEALALGCVVLLQRDALSQQLQRAGLPVVTVPGDDWASITPADLSRWLAELGPRTRAIGPQLTRSWWLREERLSLGRDVASLLPAAVEPGRSEPPPSPPPPHPPCSPPQAGEGSLIKVSRRWKATYLGGDPSRHGWQAWLVVAILSCCVSAVAVACAVSCMVD